ncbi:hypothetical protein RHK97_002544 [Acinetobacter baumannii]|uniref:hypothetical protein n=1 Tax=Acinetobacter baumannii TaxID=470 RepID=UPI001CDCF558|nr:hypothetical protein [Acinetobacter baumannii]EKV4682632.1 hypothetical protein [Acinetobacter baumannii]EKV7986252.1 hypothetical protein [Acinetobacter baumannii]EKW5931410.1 hypothetical protein [Acinetobacter baumannii]EKX6549008.1 hypothetical protein [Acinetobacter baumannii]ELB3493104.1 hypothetical protein [Acinetobacter baumannii]
MTDLNKEKEKYLQWHFENWKSKYAQDDAPEFAKTMYDRIYQHFHTDQISERESGFEAWLEAKAQAVPEGYVLVTEDQAKDAARLDFMLKEHRVICTDTNYDENYELSDEGFCVNEVYWIDGWDRLTETVHQTKREAIDKAMEASESGANQ